MNTTQATPTRPRTAALNVPLTIQQFCERYGISKYIYYRMRKRGETPVETAVSPRRSVILPASLREWERRHFAPRRPQQ
ncbi:hypothetical protein R75461_07748 [Paraburkholderia nemoris]|uniref:hypothetical protein n=1 Tax=Paraburkholderia nemoris TaxID=2793076 RepID=UPI00190B3D3B|nr:MULTISPECIES: hypothetical protein [Paraburkholderia]MBK3786552.1 hypothetical protein [Paraburkholderia aspalathi]CAE6856688.1 hypothetical protein R75461_07748 [Paraburkholderia nemoris]